jgi:hypothetical protein
MIASSAGSQTMFFAAARATILLSVARDRTLSKEERG